MMKIVHSAWFLGVLVLGCGPEDSRAENTEPRRPSSRGTRRRLPEQERQGDLEQALRNVGAKNLHEFICAPAYDADMRTALALYGPLEAQSPDEWCPMDDREFMREALREAQAAYERGECPVGAVLTRHGKIVARAGNRESELNDPTAHAEILVLREAGRVLGQRTFMDCRVYTTLWPCPMCENAMLRAKIRSVVCGGRSFKYIYEVAFNASNLVKVGPIMDEECRELFIRWLRTTGRTFILEHEGL